MSGENADAMFNDILGTSLGVAKDGGYSAIDKTSFGADSTDKSSFFTGKPYVEDLGYAFLMRNYRSDMGKWLSQDLIGYPDGWNNLAYCNNGIIDCFDLYGAAAFLNYEPKSTSSGKDVKLSINVMNADLSGNFIFSNLDISGYNTVFAHGLSRDIGNYKKGTVLDASANPISANTLSNNIKNAEGYDPELPVLLIVCYAGESYARDLSAIMGGIPVFASPNFVPIDFAYVDYEKFSIMIQINGLIKYE